MENKLVLRGIDLIKGATKKGMDFNSPLNYDAMPWQMVNLKDKTSDWKKWVSDYFEWVGMRQVNEKSKKYIKNRMLAAGILDMDDYTIGGEENHTYLNSIYMEQEFVDPLKRFYPLIPSFINVLKGDFIKRDKRAFALCIDRYTEDQKLQYKMDMVNKIVMEDAMNKKKKALEQAGLTPMSEQQLNELSPEEKQQAQQQSQQYQQELSTEQKLVESQQKFKKYRHGMEELAQLIYNKDRQRMNMDELEEEAFIETICNSEISVVLEMKEDDYKIKFPDNSKTFHHVSPDITYYSEGDYYGYFETVSIGDIINEHGKDLSDDNYTVLQSITDKFYGITGHNINPRLMTDGEKSWQSPYYDATKKQPDARSDIAKSQFVQNEIINNILDYGNNTSWNEKSSTDLMNPSSITGPLQGKPKMFRKMVAYIKGQRKIGWLTKKDRSGYLVTKVPLWVDENFKVTEKPVYDNSLVKEKSSENLIYGEHIDWSWTNEWRRFIKYTPNYSQGSWWGKEGNNDPLNTYSIYLDGNPIDCPFKSTSTNSITIQPPFEGRQFKMKGVRPVSMVESLSLFQILTNICVNRVPDIIADDIGLALWLNHNSIQNRNTIGIESEGDPLENAMDKLRTHKVLTTHIDRDLIKEIGNSAPIAPQVLNLSRIQEAQNYLGMAVQLKEMAGETIGISRQRLAQSKASETATQTQQGINYSETQTEYIFDQFIVKFMPRVYQKMVEAGMYYASKSETARAFYQTSTEGNAFLEVENMENPLRQYSIYMLSDSKSKELNSKLEQLFMSKAATDGEMLEIAEGMIADSPTQKLEALRKAQIDRESRQEKEYEQQMAQQKQAQEAAQKMQADLFAQQEKLKQMEIDAQHEDALTRALGGIQTDNNKDGQLDAMQNLRDKISGMQNKISNNSGKLQLETKKHDDSMQFNREKLLSDQSIAQKELAIALANIQKSDDKALNKQIAKKQGVS